MNLDSYIQPGEELNCRTETKKGGSKKEGELGCTDSRLLFVTKKSVLDIQISSIDEIKYERRPIAWDKITIAIVLLLFAGLSGGVARDIELIPELVGPIIAVGAVTMAIALLIEAYLAIKDTITIRTNDSEHTFRSGDLGNIPHAIRGVADS